MRKTLTLDFWENNVDKLITDNEFPLLNNSGSRTREQADQLVEQIYLDFSECEYSNRNGSYGGVAGDKDGSII